MGRPKENAVYNFFEIFDDTKTSQCLIEGCGKLLRTTHGANLVKHVKHCHPEQYEVIQNLNNDRRSSYGARSISISNSNDDDDDSKGSETLEEVLLSDPVFKYFSKEKNRTARCDLCHDTVPLRVTQLKTHMKELHPEIKPNEDSDTEEQKNSYQEIVYFYESDGGKDEPKPNKVSVKQKLREQEVIRLPESRKRRFSFTRERGPTQETGDEELVTFTKYITCLMKPLSKDVCTQLQMDIINLIMAAKLKNNILKETLNACTQIDNSQPPIILTVDGNMLKSDPKTRNVFENNSFNDSQNSNIQS